MQCIIILLLYYLLLSVLAGTVNYCGSKMCRNTDSHTFCQYAPGPCEDCTGYIPALLSKEEKARIMARLNRRRNDASYGRLRGLPSAGNMLKLRWVEELAREAQLWADQCRPPATPEEQDVCRDLYSITVGQCVASVVGEAPGLRVESMIDMWYLQGIMYKGNVTSYQMSQQNGGYFGDFVQMIWSRAYMVGCGRSKFMTSWQGRMRSVERLVCNIAPRGPVPGRSLWTPALPASACPPRSVPDDVLQGLCNFQPDLDETQDVDNSFTLEEHITINTVLDFERNSSLDVHGNLDRTYLTRLAIATMINPITTPMYYNSIQKRDIVELVELEELQNGLNKFIFNENILNLINNTMSFQNIVKKFDETPKQAEIKVKKSEKEIKLLGRPKTYNIEELMTDGVDQLKDNNLIDNVDDILKIIKEPYDDYNLVEVEEDNGTNTRIINLESTIGDNVKPYEEINIPVKALTMKTTIILKTEENKEDSTNITTTAILSKIVNNTIADMDFESSAKNDSIDDYLADPETVQQLQEALDRMERTMEPHIQQTQGKVRRELRDTPAEQYMPETADRRIPAKYYQSADLEALNKTLERGPVMNMMFKYVPYLKEYERNLLSRPINNGSLIVSNLYFTIFYIFVMVC